MPRGVRVLIDNACYYVITRGNQKQIVFYEEEDYQKYLVLLRKYKLKYPSKIYGYCLMNNHVHLLFDPSDRIYLKNFMHGVNLTYAKWFNYKYEKCGHLWQNRYRSFVIQKDRCLIDCLNYIEYNPVRAELTLRADEYKWSSYRSRTLGKKDKLVDPIKFV